jgi:cell division protein FtsW
MIAALMMNISSDWMNRLSRPALILGMLSLVLVLMPGIGVEVNGAKRWLNLGVSRFQVVEAVKLALIMSLAAYIVKHKKSIQNSMLGVLKPLVMVVIIAVLLLVQPDFGSAALLMIITLIMIYVAGARYRDLTVISLLAGSAMAVIAWAEPYRVKRLVNFVDPWQDPFNAGFQLVQALIAIGRGEITGVGIGSSVQKLFYLPEAHTDFIFAVFAEEMGFIGILVMVALFLLLIYRIFKVARNAFDNGNEFAGYMCTGIAVWLALQAFLSMGVNLGLLPTKGLTLPFISSGGSAIMMNIIALSVVFRISFENRKLHYRSVKKEVEA